jgi:hypothetical protein
MLTFRPTIGAYADARFAMFLAIEEGGVPQLQPYLDSKLIPTMGVGFNLRDAGVLNAVLQQMGFDTTSPSAQYYIGLIKAALDLQYPKGVGAHPILPRAAR